MASSDVCSICGRMLLQYTHLKREDLLIICCSCFSSIVSDRSYCNHYNKGVSISSCRECCRSPKRGCSQVCLHKIRLNKLEDLGLLGLPETVRRRINGDRMKYEYKRNE